MTGIFQEIRKRAGKYQIIEPRGTPLRMVFLSNVPTGNIIFGFIFSELDQLVQHFLNRRTERLEKTQLARRVTSLLLFGDVQFCYSAGVIESPSARSCHEILRYAAGRARFGLSRGEALLVCVFFEKVQLFEGFPDSLKYDLYCKNKSIYGPICEFSR